MFHYNNEVPLGPVRSLSTETLLETYLPYPELVKRPYTTTSDCVRISLVSEIVTSAYCKSCTRDRNIHVYQYQHSEPHTTFRTPYVVSSF